MSEGYVHILHLDSTGLLRENPYDAPIVEQSHRLGVPFSPRFLELNLVHARVLKGSTNPSFFLLVARAG